MQDDNLDKTKLFQLLRIQKDFKSKSFADRIKGQLDRYKLRHTTIVAEDNTKEEVLCVLRTDSEMALWIIETVKSNNYRSASTVKRQVIYPKKKIKK